MPTFEAQQIQVSVPLGRGSIECGVLSSFGVSDSFLGIFAEGQDSEVLDEN